LIGYDVKSIWLDARGLQSLLSAVKAEQKRRNPAEVTENVTAKRRGGAPAARKSSSKRRKGQEEGTDDIVSDGDDEDTSVIMTENANDQLEESDVEPRGASSSSCAPKAKAQPMRRVPTPEESEKAAVAQRALFVRAVPGLKTVLSRESSGKGNDLLEQLGKSLCTNGICASIFPQRPRVQAAQLDAIEAEAFFNRREDYDLSSRCPPQSLRPGRRDMIVAYEEVSKSSLTVSTAAHHIRKSLISATTACTLREQRKALLFRCRFPAICRSPG
jgi:hypothetical protein